MKYRFSQPIEKSRASSYGSNYYTFNSRKLGRNVSAFSNLEYDSFISLEMNYQVEWYCERPLKEDFYVDGHKYQFIPNVYVKMRDGSDYFQIIRSDQKNLENEDKSNLWASQRNEKLIFITASDIYKGAFLSRNLSYLASCSRHYQTIDKGADANILRYIQANGFVSLGQLINVGIITPKGIPYIGDLYFRGLIKFVDIAERTISYQTEVTIGG